MNQSPIPNPHDGSPLTAHPGRGPQGRFSRSQLLIFAAGLLLLGLAFLPQMLGRRWVYQPLLDRLQREQFRLDVDAVQLSWWRPIRLRGITISDASRPESAEPLVQVGEVITDRRPLTYLFSGRDLGRLRIDDMAIDVSLFDEDGGLSDLLTALGRGDDDPEGTDRSARPLPDIDVAVAVRGAHVVVRQQGAQQPLAVIPPLDLDLAYRTEAGQRWLFISPTRLLHEVELTQALIRIGLGHAVPVLARTAWVEGTVTVDAGEVAIPLARPRDATATAEVTFHSVRAGLADPALHEALQRAARLLRRELADEIVLADGSVAEVRMADGVIHHQGLRLGLPRIDPRLQLHSQGDVSLADRSLDVLVSLPVPIELLARRDSVRELGVPTIDLPIQGELGAAEVRWDRFRTDSADVIGSIAGQLSEDAPATSAIISALGGMAGGDADETIQAAADVLGALRQRLQQRRSEREQVEANSEQRAIDPEAQAPAAAEEAAQERRPRRRPILDRLRSLRNRDDANDDASRDDNDDT